MNRPVEELPLLMQARQTLASLRDGAERDAAQPVAPRLDGAGLARPATQPLQADASAQPTGERSARLADPAQAPENAGGFASGLLAKAAGARNALVSVFAAGDPVPAPAGGAPPMAGPPPQPVEPAPSAEEPGFGPAAKLGILVIVGLFGFLGIWSATAPLSSGVVATGELIAEGNRRTIQHLEGGIVREIKVRDGDVVQRGQILMRLDEAQSSAASEGARAQFDAARIHYARLSAERDQASDITLPPDLVQRMDDAKLAELVSSQKRIFETRIKVLAGQKSVQEERIAQLGSEIVSQQEQLKSLEIQLGLLEEERKDVETLLARGLERRPRFLALQRQIAQAAGQIGQANAAIARAQQGIAQTRHEMAQIDRNFLSEVITEQRDVYARIVEAEQRLRSASDVDARRDIAAPVPGKVANLKVFTPGAVVRPGDAVLDIVPVGEAMVVEARLNINDIDMVAEGAAAEVRFSAFRAKVVPLLMGHVTHVSADVTTEQRTGMNYYKVRVEIDRSQAELLADNKLAIGMAAEVLIKGPEQTLLGYLVMPLRESFWRAWRL
jgi:HlyD family secretion protein